MKRPRRITGSANNCDDIREFGRALERASSLGYKDCQKGYKKSGRRTGEEVASMVSYQWRYGHLRALQAAYATGWWIAELESRR